LGNLRAEESRAAINRKEKKMRFAANFYGRD
jgi:hypothetical protein